MVHATVIVDNCLVRLSTLITSQLVSSQVSYALNKRGVRREGGGLVALSSLLCGTRSSSLLVKSRTPSFVSQAVCGHWPAWRKRNSTMAADEDFYDNFAQGELLEEVGTA